MATAYRRKEDDALVAQYKGADGKQHQERLDSEEYRTVREAKRHAQQLEDAAVAQCALVEGKIGKTATFENLIDWWDRNYAAKGRSFTEVGFLKKHVLAELGAKKVHEVTSGVIEGFLVKKEALGPDGKPQLKAKSINNLRELIGRIFSKAIEQEMWRAPNPIDKVPRRRVKKKKNLAVLTPDEAKALLYALDARWRGIVATALLLALRKGEILGMLKEDVDLASRELNVTRSYEYDSTKGNREDTLPIPEMLLPFLEAAIAASPNEFVFPNPSDEMYSKYTKLHVVVRRGLARAGVVVGYDHVCRRKGCGYRVRQQDAEPRRCPECQMKLWPHALPKRTRFHDLRHTTATLLLREGVSMGVVQKILRHSDIKVTEGIYSHLDIGDVKKGLAMMPVTGIEELAWATPGYHPGREPAGEEVAAEFAATSPIEKKMAPKPLGKPRNSGAFDESGRQDLNLRPLGPEPSALPG
jgi:integrase